MDKNSSCSNHVYPIFTIESKLHPWQQNKSKETVIAPKDICANDTRRVKLSKILAAIFEWAVLSSLPYNRFTIIYAINIFPPNSGTTLFLLPTLKRINFIRKESLIANRSFREPRIISWPNFRERTNEHLENFREIEREKGEGEKSVIRKKNGRSVGRNSHVIGPSTL